MESLIHLKDAAPRDFTAELRRRADAVLSGIHDDYFQQEKFEVFVSQHLGHESLVAKIAAYRFASSAILARLRDFIAPRAQQQYGNSEFLIQPIFYLRFSFPGIYYSDRHRDAFLDSQPHYDRSYGIEAFTFWLALDDVDEESGGLCSFNTPEIHEHFAAGVKNRYSYDGYVEAAETVDSMLRAGTVSPAISAGDALTFDSNMLHGATKPKSRKRMSFDFRLVPVENLAKTSPSIRRIVDEANAHLDICNANNLMLLGDFLGAARILEQVETAAGESDLRRIASVLKLRPCDPEILKPGARMAWQKEYQWLAG